MKHTPNVIIPPVALDAQSKAPKYRQLYDWFRNAIVEGLLRPGQRIPSTRIMATELKISRLPLLNAFEQLHAEGYFASYIGSGTFVSSAIPDDQTKPLPLASRRAAGSKRRRQTSRLGKELASGSASRWASDSPAFRVSLPALDRFPTDVWSRLVAYHARKMQPDLMTYSDPMGYQPLREAIADYLNVARAVRCESSQIMIVTGSQQGIQISARALLDPGSQVWVENPGYPGARHALTMAGAQLIPVSVDKEGLCVDEGMRRSRKARAAYITPSHQYPLGMTMSAARRLQLLQWADRNGSWIIEDDYDSEYRFDSRPIASVQGLDSANRVIYIGTFSKVLFPSIRLGYVVVPRDMVAIFSSVRDAADIFSATLYQAVLTDFIKQGHFARHLRRMRMLYMERRDVLVKAIKTEIGGKLEVVNSEAGMHLVGFLPPGVEDSIICREAGKRGVQTSCLTDCYIGRTRRNGLILGFGGTDRKEIQNGVHSLALALNAHM